MGNNAQLWICLFGWLGHHGTNGGLENCCQPLGRAPGGIKVGPKNNFTALDSETFFAFVSEKV